MVTRTPIGLRTTLVRLTRRGTPVSNGDGDYTAAPVDLDPPQVFASIAPATPSDLARLVAGTVLSEQSLIITMPYHPGVTSTAILAWTDRAGVAHVAHATGVSNPDQSGIETVVVAVEQLP